MSLNLRMYVRTNTSTHLSDEARVTDRDCRRCKGKDSIVKVCNFDVIFITMCLVEESAVFVVCSTTVQCLGLPNFAALACH
jgi:hypothetical protein